MHKLLCDAAIPCKSLQKGSIFARIRVSFRALVKFNDIVFF